MTGRALAGLTEIAREAGIPLSTASRLASLLTESEMLRILPSGGYGPGAELIRIAGNALVSLRGDLQIQEVVRALSEATYESASAGVLVGDVIVLIAREEPDHSLRAVARVGDSISPHTSAMGKAILAHLGQRAGSPYSGMRSGPTLTLLRRSWRVSWRTSASRVTRSMRKPIHPAFAAGPPRSWTRRAWQ